jgi:predicted HicB family RNase H-like nuclease
MDHHLVTVESFSEIIKIRVTGDDRAAFAAAAATEGLSLSAWARRHLKRVAKKGDRRNG